MRLYDHYPHGVFHHEKAATTTKKRPSSFLSTTKYYQQLSMEVIHSTNLAVKDYDEKSEVHVAAVTFCSS